jgi:hypothetical protein
MKETLRASGLPDAAGCSSKLSQPFEGFLSGLEIVYWDRVTVTSLHVRNMRLHFHEQLLEDFEPSNVSPTMYGSGDGAAPRCENLQRPTRVSILQP